MKISVRSRYGLLFLLDLAENSKNLSLAVVSEQLKIPVLYLEQIAAVLKRNNFIRLVKDPPGVYTLSRPPEDILLGDVLRLLEGDMLISDPIEAGEKETRIRRCIRLMVLDKLNVRIAAVIENKTLASMTKTAQEAPMYYI